MSRTFVEIARDPRLIPGVHHYCDEWCEVCPVTSRCLAFRCTAAYRKERGLRQDEPTFQTTADAIAFTHSLAAAEGRTTPELDALLAAGSASAGFKTADRLADLAWQYAVGVSLWLVITPDELRLLRSGPTPSPEEVVLWHHLRIYLKLTRALVAKERLGEPKARLALPRSDSGPDRALEEINGSAKLTLVAVQRSRKALQQLRKSAAGDTASTLVALLDRLERGLDERFPTARAFVRVGLDVPAM
jgi:hypothetical protein